MTNYISKYLCFFFILLFIPSRSFAQDEVRVDSLLQKLKTVKNKQKVDVYNALSNEYYHSDPDKGLMYGNKALSIAKKLDYIAGIAEGHRYIGKCYRSKLDFTNAKKNFYLALPLEEKINNKVGVAECLVDIGEAYKIRGDYKQALDKYKKALKIFEKENVKEGTVRILSSIADVYYKLAKIEIALKFALKSLEISRQTGTYQGISEASLILSDAFARVGNFQEAYSYHLLYTTTKDSIDKVKSETLIKRIEKRGAKERQEIRDEERKKEELRVNKENTIRRNNIQYFLIFIFFLAFFISIPVIGKFDLPQKVIESVIFISVLILFRFILIVLLPYTDNIAEGAPVYVLLINVVLALLFMPFHKFLESRIRKKALNIEIDEDDNALEQILQKSKEKLAKTNRRKRKVGKEEVN